MRMRQRDRERMRWRVSCVCVCARAHTRARGHHRCARICVCRARIACQRSLNAGRVRSSAVCRAASSTATCGGRPLLLLLIIITKTAGGRSGRLVHRRLRAKSPAREIACARNRAGARRVRLLVRGGRARGRGGGWKPAFRGFRVHRPAIIIIINNKNNKNSLRGSKRRAETGAGAGRRGGRLAVAFMTRRFASAAAQPNSIQMLQKTNNILRAT